jgi:hypothetical protein
MVVGWTKRRRDGSENNALENPRRHSLTEEDDGQQREPEEALIVVSHG